MLKELFKLLKNVQWGNHIIDFFLIVNSYIKNRPQYN